MKINAKSKLKLLSSNFANIMSIVAIWLLSQEAMAKSDLTVGGMASLITSSFGSLTKLITAGSYLAGLGFAIGAIMKFKQHKDNPQQITIGQPIGLLFVAAALLFLPSILDVAGSTMFGSAGSVAGPSGTIYGQ